MSKKTKVVQPHGLRVEYRVNPLGVETPAPRLSWLLPTDGESVHQSAWQVLAASRAELLDENRGDLWDSGHVASDCSLNVAYAGTPLESGQRVWWKVRVWNERNQVSAWSEPASWSMGLLQAEDWKAAWISSSEAAEPGENPVILLRNRRVLRGSVARAVCSISGLGYYELHVNGHPASDHRLDPGFTDYTRRVLYVSHDLTTLLREGENCIEVRLAGGWYHASVPDLFGFERAPWRDCPKLLLQVAIDYADGGSELWKSDERWEWAHAATTYADIRGGETLDARKRAGPWRPVAVSSTPAGRLSAQFHPPLRVTEVVPPASLTEPSPGIHLFDFGKNLTGAVRLRATGRPGQCVTLRFNELLKDDGTLDLDYSTSHTHGRFQRGELILSGAEADIYDPHFTYHGFRYVQVEGLSTPPAPADVEAFALHTDLESAGQFESSNSRLNQLQGAVRRTLLNSVHGMPAEEPTREKMGWTFDAQVLMDAYVYNFDAATIYRKFLDDLIDAQDPNGHLPPIVPTNGWGRIRPDGAPGEFADPWWGATLSMIADGLYLYYDDRRALEAAYAPGRAYLEYLRAQARDHQIDWFLGDWLDRTWSDNRPGLTPVVQTSTAAYFVLAQTVSRHARLLGHDGDAVKYAELADTIRAAFNRVFLDEATGFYQRGSQSAQSVPLYWDLAPEALRPLLLRRLLEDLAANDGHLTTGFVGALPMVYGLSDWGHADEMFTAVMKESGPGWLYMVEDENSTLGENLNPESYGTRHHPYLAWIGGWFYRSLAGIRADPSAPGFKRILIRPEAVRGLDWVRAHYDSAQGRITSEWERSAAGRISLRVAIPPNTTGRVVVPGREAKPVGNSSVAARFLQVQDCRSVYEIEGGGEVRFESEPA